MAGAYTSEWMSLAEALEYLDFIADDRRARFKNLRDGVRDRAIDVRTAGKERDRSLFVNLGLTDDPDYAEQVDNRARLDFISCDPDLIDLGHFGELVELRRADVVGCFGKRPLLTDGASARPASAKKIEEFCKSYMERENAAGGKPTQQGCERAAREANLRATRDQLRETFNMLQSEAGCDVRRGRPRKSRP
jgi:hypothetical protein